MKNIITVVILTIALVALLVGVRTLDSTETYITYMPLLNSCGAVPTPTLAPNPTPTLAPSEAKGLACAGGHCYEDMQTLGASWYYVWSDSHAGLPGNIPMSYYGEIPDIPADTTHLLVFNEPNNLPGAGGPVTPEDAAVLVKAIERRYPNVYIIVGNVHPYSNSAWGYPMYGYEWLLQFFEAYGRGWTMGVGIHSYDRTYSGHIQQWEQYFSHLGRNRDYWLTEWTITTSRPRDSEFSLLVDAALDTFDHVAPWTNRPNEYQNWYTLLDESGNLTSYGEIYKGER